MCFKLNVKNFTSNLKTNPDLVSWIFEVPTVKSAAFSARQHKSRKHFLMTVLVREDNLCINFVIQRHARTHARTHTRLTALIPGLLGSASIRQVKTNLDFTEARDSEWQWYQLGYMQVCTSLQTDNHASTPPLSFLQAGCPSCRPTNSVKALKG